MATVWYAQAIGNANDVGMWNDAPDGSGNTLTWANLDPTDTLRANGNTSVTLNVNTTCAQIDTLTSGGRFILADGITLTADVLAGTAYCVSFPSGSASIVGNVTGGAAIVVYGVVHASSGHLTITGNVSGGIGGVARGVNSTQSGGTTITGNVTGGSGSGASGIRATSAPVNITGTVTGGTAVATAGAEMGGSVVSQVIGDVIARGGPGVVSTAYGLLHFDGDIISHASGITGLASQKMALVDGANHYTDYAEADTTPGDVTGELIRHYGLGLFPTPAQIAAAMWSDVTSPDRTLTA